MSVSVRLAREADTADVTRLTTQLGYDVEASALGERLSRILARNDQLMLIAEDDGSVVGWLHAAAWEYVESEMFVVIGGLVVDKDHRRQGIGRLLMAHAERWAEDRGCLVVRLWSSSTRARAHQFYASLGYTKVKTQHSFAKSLDPSRQGDLIKLVPRVED